MSEQAPTSQTAQGSDIRRDDQGNILDATGSPLSTEEKYMDKRYVSKRDSYERMRDGLMHDAEITRRAGELAFKAMGGPTLASEAIQHEGNRLQVSAEDVDDERQDSEIRRRANVQLAGEYYGENTAAFQQAAIDEDATRGVELEKKYPGYKYEPNFERTRVEQAQHLLEQAQAEEAARQAPVERPQ